MPNLLAAHRSGRLDALQRALDEAEAVYQEFMREGAAQADRTARER